MCGNLYIFPSRSMGIHWQVRCPSLLIVLSLPCLQDSFANLFRAAREYLKSFLIPCYYTIIVLFCYEPRQYWIVLIYHILRCLLLFCYEPRQDLFIYIYIILRYLLSIYCLYASYILVAQHVTSNAASLGIYCRILFYVSPTFYPNSSQVLFSHSHLLSYATYTHYLITTQAYLCTLHWYLQTTHLHPTPHPTGRDDHF